MKFSYYCATAVACSWLTALTGVISAAVHFHEPQATTYLFAPAGMALVQTIRSLVGRDISMSAVLLEKLCVGYAAFTFAFAAAQSARLLGA